MKKIINQPENVVDDMLNGLAYAHEDLVRRLPDTGVIVRQKEEKGKVALVSGGGSGHEPAHAGFVGKGMLAAAVCGPVFTSPTPDQVLTAIQEVDAGAGVFLIIKNYSGDIMNFEMAKDMAEMDDIAVDFVVVDDDIAVEDSLYTAGKRGVAGTVLVHKILGAVADMGANLEEIKALADKIVPNIKTLGVALSGATVPEVGHPGFTLEEQEIEFGVGIHGEPGYRKAAIAPSKELAAEIVEKLKGQFEWKKGDRFALLVNGLGSTPLMEQYIFINDVKQLLEADGLEVDFKKVGDYMTAIDMAGLSLTMMKLEEENWLDKLNYATETIAWV